MSKQLIALIVVWLISAPFASAQKVHQLHAEDENYLPAPGPAPTYSKPQMVGPPHAKVDAVPKPKPKEKPKPIKAGITFDQHKAQPPVRPIVAPKPVAVPVVNGVLPDQFLGRWQVIGSRSAVEAQAQYQSGINGIFSGSTSNIWNIQGNAVQGYTLTTDSGVSTALNVQTKGDVAVLRYQHPINKTMAQEALVMQLVAGGAQFDGLEKISIVKPGEQGARAKVTYKLVGQRQ
ncbi:MAG: hypothetical protein K2X81_23960 [Candidatus Obscuribacterales bacterium]|nr:hypothetical protein [Candidatus Obscuribacterales bacterium]